MLISKANLSYTLLIIYIKKIDFYFIKKLSFLCEVNDYSMILG